jgi:hypothetical protein
VLSRKRFRTTAAAVVAVASLGAGLLAGLGPVPGGASSHREAPLVSADPQVDNTDVYAFVSPERPDTVTLISSWIPFQEPAGGPNFYAFAEDVLYDFAIDNDGDAMADVMYRFRFTNHYRNPDTFLYNTGTVTTLDDPDLNFRQTYDLLKIRPGVPPNGVQDVTLLLDDAPVVPSNVGRASMPNYRRLAMMGNRRFAQGTSQAFAGQTDDAFFLDLRVFDLLYGADFSEAGDDTLAGFNVNTLAIQVPKTELALDGKPGENPIIGVWSKAMRQTTRIQHADGTQDFTGEYIPVSRLGNPLVNEVVIPVKDKDLWNNSFPAQDGQFLEYVLEPELPELIEGIYGIPAPDLCGDDSPPRCREDLVAVFLTGVEGLNQPPGVVPSEMMRLNMSIAPCEPGSCGSYSRLGVIGGDNAGYPNGRRPADDVIDISLQVVEGELVGNPNDLGDGVDENDRDFRGSFPYLALPFAGSEPAPHPGLL